MSGAAALLAIGLFAIVGLTPMRLVPRNERRAAGGNVALARLTTFRTSLADWRFFVDSVRRSTAATVDPAMLAQATALEQHIVADGRAAVSALDAVSLTADAERAAFAQVWTSTGTIATHVSQVVSAAVNNATDAVATARRAALIAAAIAAFATIATIAITLVVSRRARRQEHAARASMRRRTFETTMQQALEMAKCEPDVYRVLTEALQASTPNRQIEMLVPTRAARTSNRRSTRRGSMSTASLQLVRSARATVATSSLRSSARRPGPDTRSSFRPARQSTLALTSAGRQRGLARPCASR